MESDANVLQYLIRHVFLPPQLPQESDSNGCRMDHRLLLQVEQASRRFIEFLDASDESTITKWERARKMLHKMSNLHQDQFLIKHDLVSAFKRMDVRGKWNYSTLSAFSLTCVLFRRSPLIYCVTECRRHISQAGPESYDL